MRSIALLTYGSEYAREILRGLAAAECGADVALVVTPPRRKGARAAAARTLRAARDLLTGGGPAGWRRRLDGLARRTVDAGVLNGDGMLAELCAAAPDLLLLAGTGIVSDEALRVPRLGTVNVHPALLPWVRGVGAVERSIERRVPVGVTAHRVDAGIDTGAVLRRRLIPVEAADDLEALRRRAYSAAAGMMVEVASHAVREGLPRGEPQTVRYPYCRRPSREEVARVAASVREGLAVALHRAWRERAGSDELPADFADPPGVTVRPLRPRRGRAKEAARGR